MFDLFTCMDLSYFNFVILSTIYILINFICLVEKYTNLFKNIKKEISLKS